MSILGAFKHYLALAFSFTEEDPFFLHENRYRIFNHSELDDSKITRSRPPKLEPELEEFFSPMGERAVLVRKYDKVLDCLLSLNCVRLVRGQDETADPDFNYSIVFLGAKRDGRGLDWEWKNVLTCLLLKLGSIYISVKHLLRIYFLTKLEHHQERLETYRDSNCTSFFLEIPQEMIDEHQQLKWWDSKLNLSYWSSPIFGRMFLANLWPIGLVFSSITLWHISLRTKELRLDCLAFLLNSEGESRRAEREIAAIIESLTHHTTQMVGRYNHREDYIISAGRESAGQEFRYRSYYLEPTKFSLRRTRPASVSIVDADELVETLRRIKSKRLVRPAPSDKKFEYILLPFITHGAIVGVKMACFGVLAFFIPVTIDSYFTYQTMSQQNNQTETYFRIASRFRSGAGWNNSKIMRHELTRIITGQTYQHNNCTEMGYNQTRTSQSLRAFMDQEENRGKINFSVVESFSSSNLCNYLCEYWPVLLDVSMFTVIPVSVLMIWMHIQLNSILLQVHWIWQIKNQLNWCTKLARKLNLRKETLFLSSNFMKSPNRREMSSLTKDEIDLEKDQVELAECLTICYINYMLFQRRHKRSKRLMNFLISQIAVFATLSYTTVYLATDLHKCGWKNLVLGTAIVLFICNVSLVLACSVCKSFESLVKRKYYLIAQLAKDSLKPRGNLIVSLWIRQLTTKKEIENFIAPNFVGIRVSVEKIFSINTYVLLFWFLMIR